MGHRTHPRLSPAVRAALAAFGLLLLGFAFGAIAATARGSEPATDAETSAESEPGTPAAPETKAEPDTKADAAADAATDEHLEANPGRVIRGTIAPPDKVERAYLWERASDRRVPVRPAPKTGRFEVRGLKLGTYDLVVVTDAGRWEGLDTAPRLSEYDALIPPEYRTEDVGLASSEPLSEADRKAVRRHIHEVKRHENRIRDLDLCGTADRACVLVELVLDRDFVGRKGDEIVWRMEQWYYEKKYGAWSRFRTRVLHRRRVSKRVWETWTWQFEPALGGFAVTDDRAEPVEVAFVIPEKPDPAKGLAGDRPPPAK
jgi:hypothetical protein